VLGHVTLGARDIEAAGRFYDAVLDVIGLARIETTPGLAIGYARRAEATPQFWVLRPHAGGAPAPGNGHTLAFEAESRAQVDAFHAACLAQGGADEGAPDPRPRYHADYYGAYARDRDGNKIAGVCHRPEPA